MQTMQTSYEFDSQAPSPVIHLSVIVPAHDEGPLLEEAIRSIQTAIWTVPAEQALSVETIIALDAPTTETLTEAENLSAELPAVRVIRNLGPRGPGATRNAGVADATGEWLAFLDGDDRWRDNALRALRRGITSYPDANWLAGDFTLLDHQPGKQAKGGELRHRPRTRQALRNAYDRDVVIRLTSPLLLFLEVVLCHTITVFVRRSTFESVGGFDLRLTRAEDVHLWYRLARLHDFHFVPEVIAEYRQRPSTINRRGHSPGHGGRQALTDLLTRREFAPYKKALRKRLARACLEDCNHFRKNGKRLPAAAAALSGLRRQPMERQLWHQLAAVIMKWP